LATNTAKARAGKASAEARRKKKTTAKRSKSTDGQHNQTPDEQNLTGVQHVFPND